MFALQILRGKKSSLTVIQHFFFIEQLFRKTAPRRKYLVFPFTTSHGIWKNPNRWKKMCIIGGIHASQMGNLTRVPKRRGKSLTSCREHVQTLWSAQGFGLSSLNPCRSRLSPLGKERV